ncbi:MAG: helix-turn-helix domain-containing protein [Candidatus Thalassarchaeaceae archaeon]|jgi:predicted DNA binding protein
MAMQQTLVRRVRLRWSRSDLEGVAEFKQLMDAVRKYEVLAHMKLGEEGIEHLAEIIPVKGELSAMDDIPTFDVLEVHERDDDSGSYLVSVNLTHSLPMMMLDLEKIHLHPPYGLDEDGLELNFTGRSDSMKRLIELLRMMMPWDSISIQSVRSNAGDMWRGILTDRQIEVLRQAVNLGYYSDERGIKIKDLAESMGMARSTMGGHLKLIEQSVMSKVVDDLG